MLHLVDEDDAAARGGRARVRIVGLVAPVVKDGHVAPAVGPAAAHEEVREAVELEVGVEEDHGVLRRLELLENEGGLRGDGLEAELLVRVRVRIRVRVEVRIRVRIRVRVEVRIRVRIRVRGYLRALGRARAEGVARQQRRLVRGNGKGKGYG